MNYFTRELLVRLEDYQHNNPQHEPSHLLIHPIALAFIELEPLSLEVVTSLEFDPHELVVY